MRIFICKTISNAKMVETRRTLDIRLVNIFELCRECIKLMATRNKNFFQERIRILNIFDFLGHADPGDQQQVYHIADGYADGGGFGDFPENRDLEAGFNSFNKIYTILIVGFGLIAIVVVFRDKFLGWLDNIVNQFKNNDSIQDITNDKPSSVYQKIYYKDKFVNISAHWEEVVKEYSEDKKIAIAGSYDYQLKYIDKSTKQDLDTYIAGDNELYGDLFLKYFDVVTSESAGCQNNDSVNCIFDQIDSRSHSRLVRGYSTDKRIAMAGGDIYNLKCVHEFTKDQVSESIDNYDRTTQIYGKFLIEYFDIIECN
jgi:hypothetical protein